MSPWPVIREPPGRGPFNPALQWEGTPPPPGPASFRGSKQLCLGAGCKRKKDDPAAPTPWSSGFAPSPSPARYSGLCGPPVRTSGRALPPKGLPPGAPHRGLFYSEQTHFGLNFLLLLSEADTSALQVLGNQPGLSPLPPPPARLAGSFLEFIASVQHECAPSAAESGGLKPGQNASSAQLRGPHAARPEPQGTGTTCALMPSPHTCTHSASLPRVALLLIHKEAHSHTHSDCVLTPGGRRERHTFKRFSLHKGQHDSPYANRTGPRVRGGGQVGRRTLGGEGPYRFWKPGTGPSLLGALAASWLPRGHCAQGMT